MKNCETYFYVINFSFLAVLSLYFKRILVEDLNTESELENWASVAFHMFLVVVYTSPILTSYMADTVIGRFRTFMLVSLIDLIGHVILVFAALTDKESHPNDFSEKYDFRNSIDLFISKVLQFRQTFLYLSMTYEA